MFESRYTLELDYMPIKLGPLSASGYAGGGARMSLRGLERAAPAATRARGPSSPARCSSSICTAPASR